MVVFFHGLTNCPQQFDSLARRVAARGANVLLVRIPHHGLEDRMTTDLSHLGAAELALCADDAVDLAVGLGEHVTVAGLSLGGVLAAWVGQRRPEVERVVEIAPLFAVSTVPRFWTVALTRLLITTPNRFIWWDGHVHERLPGPPLAYPRFSTRALGETLRLGLAVRRLAQRHRPAARELVLVTEQDDPAVGNASSFELAELWRRSGVRVTPFEFPASMHLSHDMIDPLQVGARVDVVYPRLDDLILPLQNAR